MGRLANFGQNSKQGGRQKSPKLTNGEVGVNEEAGKNAAIRNFIEINHQTILWKYQQKEHKKYKSSLSTWRIFCYFARFSCSHYIVLHCNQKTILCNVEETTCTTNSFLALRRLHATAVNCAHELINGESGVKGEASKILQN